MEFGQDPGDGERMLDERFAGAALLSFVGLGREREGVLEQYGVEMIGAPGT